METLAISELIAALTDAGVGPNTLLLIVGGAVAYRYFKANGFAKQSDIKALGRSLDAMRVESKERADANATASQKRDTELHDRIDKVVSDHGDMKADLAFLRGKHSRD